MQEIRLMGVVGQDAQIKTSRAGKEFGIFSLGCSEKTGRTTADGKEEFQTMWYDIFCSPEEARQIIKGMHLMVTGKPKISAYINKENQAVGTCSVIFANIFFKLHTEQQTQTANSRAVANNPSAQNYNTMAQNNPALQQLQVEFDAAPESEDDLPF